MRVGIFGGTFDPPHLGHRLVAIDALERLGLDRVVLIPAATQPLKAGVISADAAGRLAMTRLLVAGDSRFEVDPIEIDRGGLSFMVDTLRAIAARAPADERFLLVGADVVSSFHRWRDPAGVRRLATLVVLTRATNATAAGMADFAGIGSASVGGPPLVVETRRVDLSSTEIRARVHAGLSIRGFVPESVADFIEAAGLYR